MKIEELSKDQLMHIIHRLSAMYENCHLCEYRKEMSKGDHCPYCFHADEYNDINHFSLDVNMLLKDMFSGNE